MRCVGIPSYNRPSIIKKSVKSFYDNNFIELIIVVADAGLKSIAQEYKGYLSELDKKVFYEVKLGRRGSVNARNRLLRLGYELGCEELIMADDDYFLVDRKTPVILSSHIKNGAGMAGGAVRSLIKRTVDPDFFLNSIVADPISDITGYVLLDVRHGPRYAKYLTPFFSINGELLNKVRYDNAYNTPTAFREESDLQRQVRKLGYKLVFDPRAWVIHLGLDEGGNRNNMDEGERLYWKSFGSTSFILKWDRGFNLPLKLTLSSLIMMIYRPRRAASVLYGIRDSIIKYKRDTSLLEMPKRKT
ncbi:MAG: hypothetical protein G5Z42_05890 [Caldisphaeraceae archaeon]|nr:hypothetical protein [Caldisphaeraceae archaeon]